MVTIRQNNIKNINAPFMKKYDYYYDVFNNNEQIGIAAISINSNDMLYIFIDEKFRGYNLGKEAFNEILKEFKKFNINKINVIIDSKNIQIKRIINHQQTAIINSGNNIEQYEIKIQ